MTSNLGKAALSAIIGSRGASSISESVFAACVASELRARLERRSGARICGPSPAGNQKIVAGDADGRLHFLQIEERQ
jgi:hypothetical protein